VIFNNNKMIDRKFVKKLKKSFDKKEGERRQIIALANIVLHDSKRVIFSLHRGTINLALTKIKEIEKILTKLEKQFGKQRLFLEGSYKEAVEEYVEAKTFYMAISGEKIGEIKDFSFDFESYLGGFCDLTGELVRLATNKASKKEFSEVEKIKKIIDDIMAELIQFDMTGYLRTKYDQAKNNLRKIERINYEIKIFQE